MGEQTTRILLVEDEEAHAELARRAFEADSGRFHLTIAGSLAEARASLAESRPHLIIADLALPDGLGTDLLSAEREDDEVPLVVLTAHGDERAAVESIKAGALDYVVKSKETLAGTPQIAQQVLREWRHIAQRRRAEEALRQSENQARSIIQTANDAFIAIDEGGTITDWNPQAEVVFGWSRPEAVGRQLTETVIPAEYWESHRRGLARFLATGQGTVLGRQIEVSGLRRDGSLFPMELTISAVRTGDTWMFYAFMRDITGRKRVEQELRKLSRAVEQVSVAVVLTDTEGRFEYVNPAFTNITGYTPEEVKGKKPSILKSGRTTQEEYRQLWETIVSGEEWRGELHNKRKDGGFFWASASISPIRDPEGVITHFIGVQEDITERKLAEDRLRASLSEKDVLLKEINHRVKNNLQIISSLLSLQSRDIQDQPAREAFKVGQDRIQAMALVHEKLYQSEDLGQIDFGEYLQSLTADLYDSYGLSTKGIDLKIDVDHIFFGVDTAIPCGLIVNELVSNSLKYAFPEGAAGEISVSVRGADDRYTMVVKDNGVGLPEGLDTLQTTTLGLTIVNALAQQIRGAIDFSRDGGSEIKITFPAS